MRRLDWTEIDPYLIATHETLTGVEQAQHLGVYPGTVRIRKRDLGLSAESRACRRLWADDERARATELLTSGLSLREVARRLKRSPQAIIAQISVKRARSGLHQVRTVQEVAELFGGGWTRVRSWLKRRWIYHKRTTTTKNSHALITDTELMAFIENRYTWPDWEVKDISDPDWRAFAREVREKTAGRWIRVTDIAARIHYDPSVVYEWVRNGIVPATRYGWKWFIWEPDLDGVVLPPKKVAA